MALRWEGMPCSVCKEPIAGDDRDTFATSHFLPGSHPLWEHSDAVIHWACYERWPHRRAFARAYFESRCGWTRQNEHWGVAWQDDDVMVSTNPARPVHEIGVMLAESGTEERLDLDDWESWIESGWYDAWRHDLEREAMAAVRPRLLAGLPTVDALLDAAGMKDHCEADPPEGIVGAILEEGAFRKMVVRFHEKGGACPHCGHFSTEHEPRQVDEVSEEGPRSRMACDSCGAEFGPMDL